MVTAGEYLKSLGRRMAALRKQAGLSQEQLSEKSHLSVRAISDMERGEVNASILILQAYAEGLDIPLSRLISDPEQLDAEIATVLAGKPRAEQLRALELIQVLFKPIDESR